MKKYVFWLLVSISLHFISCEKSNDLNKQTELVDSIVYYNQKIDTINLSDIKNSIYNRKVLSIVKKIKNDSTRIDYYYLVADNFYKNKNLIEFKDVSNLIISEGSEVKDAKAISKGYLNLGDYYLQINKNDSAFYFFDKAEIIFLSKKIYRGANNVRLRKAILQYYGNDFLGCETTIYKSLPYYEKINNQVQLNISYSLLGLCKIETKEFDEGLSFLNLADKYARELSDETGSKQSSINNIALLYFKKGDYKKALEFYSKLNNNLIKKNFPKIYAYARQYIAFSNYKLGKIDNFNAEYDFVLKECKKLNLSIVEPLIQLSEFYESQKDMAKAQKYALEAYDISVKDKLFREKLLALKQLTNVFPEKAKYYSSEYIKLSDSIATVDKKIQNTFARIEYRVDELNNENELLAQRNKQFIYYTLIGILVLALGVVYFWQKQKQKQLLFANNQQKSNEQIYQLMLDQQVKYEEGRTIEKQRIAQELHDGVMNKLAAIRFNLYALKRDRTDKTIENCLTHVDEIQTVEKEIRTLSHDLSKEVFEKSNNFEAIIQAIYWSNDQDAPNISYHFDPKIKWETISAEAKLHCYRIIQESIINCLKYAQAQNCSVSLTLEETIFVIKISDDGIGFDTQKVKSGIGLKNIAERVALLKGKFKILSALNQGTTLFINVPINNITV